MLDDIDIEYIGTKRACHTISSTPSRSASPGIRMTGSSRAVTGFTLKVLNEAESSTITSLSDQKSTDSANKEYHRLITFHNPVGYPWTLRSPDVVVGRSPPGMALTTSTAMFRCPVVSRKHAKFAFYDGKLFLCDTESHHGTHIYRPGISSLTSTKLVPYNEVQVNDGDVITFGKTVRNRELVKPVVVKVELYLDDLTEGARLGVGSEDAYKELATKTPITPITPAPILVNVGSTSTNTNTSPKSGTGRYGVFSPSSSESEGSSSSCEHSDEMDISSDSSASDASDASDDDDEVEEIPAPKPVHASASPASLAFKMLKSIGGGSFTSPSGSGSGSPITSTPTPASWWSTGNGAPLPPPEPTTKPPPQPPTPPSTQPRARTHTPFVFGSAAASQTHTPFTFGLGLGMGMGGMGLPRFFDANGPGGSASAASIPRDVDKNECVRLPPLNLGPVPGLGGGEEGQGGDENQNECDNDDGLSSVFAVSGSAGASPSPSPHPQSPFVNPAASTSASVSPASSFSFYPAATSASPSIIALQRFKRMQKRMKLRELFSMSGFKGFGSPLGSKEKGKGRSRSKSPMSMSASEFASTPSSPTVPSSFPEEQEQQQTGTSSIQCAQLRDGDVDVDVGAGGSPDDGGAGILSVPVDYFADPIDCGLGLDLDLDLDPWRVDPFSVGGVEDQDQDVPKDKGKGKAMVIDVEENRGAEDVDDEVDDDEDDDEDEEDEDDDVEFIGMGHSQEEQDSLFTDSVLARGAQLLPNVTLATPAKSDSGASNLPSTSAPPSMTNKDDDATANFIKAQLAINDSVADRLDTIQAKRKGIDDEVNARDKKINDLIQGHRRDSDGIRASLRKIEEAFEKYQGGVKDIREDMEIGMEDMKGGLQEFRLELGGVGGRLGDVEDRVERLGMVRDQVDRLLERMEGVEIRVVEGDEVARDEVGDVREQMGQMRRRVEGLEFDEEIWKAQTDEGKRLVEEMRGALNACKPNTSTSRKLERASSVRCIPL
ncbi:hypothetical protein PM082_017186 [Marasmius tenuissimus]|nr:hypothetical protein PM082_017186 [Marasmius tenuissimus]